MSFYIVFSRTNRTGTSLCLAPFTEFQTRKTVICIHRFSVSFLTIKVSKSVFARNNKRS